MHEIDTILEHDITPTLVRLRGEKTHYLKWSANNTEEERLQRFCVAHEFAQAEKTLGVSAEEVAALDAEQSALEASRKEASVSRARSLLLRRSVS